jgi:hypothetical protein
MELIKDPTIILERGAELGSVDSEYCARFPSLPTVLGAQVSILLAPNLRTGCHHCGSSPGALTGLSAMGAKGLTIDPDVPCKAC